MWWRNKSIREAVNLGSSFECCGIQRADYSHYHYLKLDSFLQYINMKLKEQEQINEGVSKEQEQINEGVSKEQEQNKEEVSKNKRVPDFFRSTNVEQGKERASDYKITGSGDICIYSSLANNLFDLRERPP